MCSAGFFAGKQIYSTPGLNNSTVKLLSTQKHLGLFVDSKLSFNDLVSDKLIKVASYFCKLTTTRAQSDLKDSLGMKLLTRMWWSLSHLWEQFFGNSFRNMLNPLCFCSIKAQTATEYSLLCYFCNVSGSGPMNDLENIDGSILDLATIT